MGRRRRERKRRTRRGVLHIQRCLFSATLPPQVEELARSFLRDPLQV
eukprot:COSAG05_NODE_25788_length_193_cov_78.319149_1_plen_46_part_01